VEIQWVHQQVVEQLADQESWLLDTNFNKIKL
jgi:hypothetical protein